MSDIENKNLVQRALSGLVDSRDVASVAPFMSEGFVHPSPDGDDSTKAEWLARVEAAFGPTEGMPVEVLHLLAADGHVMVHSRRRLPGSAGSAGSDGPAGSNGSDGPAGSAGSAGRAGSNGSA